MALENVSVWVAVELSLTAMAMPELVVVFKVKPLAKGKALQSQLKTAPPLPIAAVVKPTVFPLINVPLPLVVGTEPGGVHSTAIKEVWALAKETATRTKIPARRMARIIFLSTPTPKHRQPAQTNGEQRKRGRFGDTGNTDISQVRISDC